MSTTRGWHRCLGTTVLAIAAGLLFHQTAAAQGVTTGGVDGFVLTEEGLGVVGASVVAVHEPTGTQYSTLVREGGAYSLPNLRVGGPYTVTVSMLGYRTESEEGIFVRLGQTV
ncbi:MAG: hypothetical protein GWM90_06245, partial [Gemmatimonadetes bacterium]|nr:carboxypeptidase regulatory-like domain-containing protein [Gemmatimonadota bacterium]NIQ53372.1 carboxypeptidase regulatory-like domain-containing protein [Gemmatimonadota bacterium]NIU73515.1 hypothetical protein [Gammaproteobacteria bacterium]NIX43724.1 hypothetical protein [Gemmatimonadota bacterium]NIY07917.1 hypothetical protein [Gemmatimonadota bacterium]